MEIIKSNVTRMPVAPVPPLWCFGGRNIGIEQDKIESINCSYYEDFKTGEYTPVLVFTLVGGIKITADYNDIEEAKFAMNYYKKEFLWKKKQDESN